MRKLVSMLIGGSFVIALAACDDKAEVAKTGVIETAIPVPAATVTEPMATLVPEDATADEAPDEQSGTVERKSSTVDAPQ